MTFESVVQGVAAIGALGAWGGVFRTKRKVDLVHKGTVYSNDQIRPSNGASLAQIVEQISGDVTEIRTEQIKVADDLAQHLSDHGLQQDPKNLSR